MIDVLIVDDSAVIRAILKQFLSSDSRFRIAGEASNGEIAVSRCLELHPDLVIMDIKMPVMDGIEATRQIMAKGRTAVVVFSTEDSASYGFQAISAGAVEMIQKPNLISSSAAFYNELKDKLFLIASQYRKTVVRPETVKQDIIPAKEDRPDIILMGASTGGPQSVKVVLQGLGKNIKVPVLLTQHIDESFAKHYAPWLSETTGLNVSFGYNGEKCLPGHVYVAPPDHHMTAAYDPSSDTYTIKLNKDAPVHFLRPAVDPMFLNAAEKIGRRCIAILLTGMGRDGADGCVALKKAGAFTICESQESCAVFGMPKAAIEDGGAQLVLPAAEIGGYVRRMLG